MECCGSQILLGYVRGNALCSALKSHSADTKAELVGHGLQGSGSHLQSTTAPSSAVIITGRWLPATGSSFTHNMPRPCRLFIYSAALRSLNAFHHRGHEPTRIAAQNWLPNQRQHSFSVCTRTAAYSIYLRCHLESNLKYLICSVRSPNTQFAQ